MTEEENNIINEARELYKAFNEYRKKVKPDSGDTDVAVKKVSFDVGKKDEEYSLNVEVDFSLEPKSKENKPKQEQ